MSPIELHFVKDMREGYGEDSEPLSLISDNFYAVGVFDGMGGSGAAICTSEYGEGRTKAYVASRIIKDAVFNLFSTEEDKSKITSETILHIAKERLEKEKSDYPTKNVSGLRSKLTREYPTTLAVVTARLTEQDEYEIISYWAGDSRNYFWNEKGFFQISKDDLDAELDPLENLRNDGSLSNCVCADREFHINQMKFNSPKNFVILSATDGCFGYFPTPMHFNNILLRSLKSSNGEEEWKHCIAESISKVTGDDISLSLIAVGYNGFEDLKRSFKSSIKEFYAIQKKEKEIEKLSAKLQKTKDGLEQAIQKGWHSYKKPYMNFLKEIDER